MGPHGDAQLSKGSMHPIVGPATPKKSLTTASCGCERNEIATAGAAATANCLLKPSASPGDTALKRYIDRNVMPSPENVATPFTAATVSVPCNASGVPPSSTSSVMVAGALTGSPRMSSTSTWKLGMVPPAVMLVGWVLNESDAGGAGVIVTCAVPLFPSEIAVIVTGPVTDCPDTSPALETTARIGSDVLQATTRPVRMLPSPSFSTVASCSVAPPARVDVAGVTSTLETASPTTVIAAVPVLPSMVAVTLTGPPTATPVTSPDWLTVASASSLLLQAGV